MQYALADRLQMTLAEVQAMPLDHFHGWLAYIAAEKEMRNH